MCPSSTIGPSNNLKVGNSISGPGIPANTTILAIKSTNIPISDNDKPTGHANLFIKLTLSNNLTADVVNMDNVDIEIGPARLC